MPVARSWTQTDPRTTRAENCRTGQSVNYVYHLLGGPRELGENVAACQALKRKGLYDKKQGEITDEVGGNAQRMLMSESKGLISSGRAHN